MNKTLRAATATLALVAAAGVAHAQGTAAAAPIKIGYVSTQALMNVVPGKPAAESLFNKEAAAFDAKRKKWSDSLAKAGADYAKAEPTMTQAKKTAEMERIQGMQTDFEAKALAEQQKLQQRQADLLAPLTELVKNTIEDLRTDLGYTIIFTIDEGSGIVSIDKNLDITDRVAARLKTKTAPTPPPPSAMAPAAMKKPPTR